MRAQAVPEGVTPEPSHRRMTLWACLRYWWQCRRLDRVGRFGDYLCIPPNATDVRVIHRKDPLGLDPETVGVKWTVRQARDDQAPPEGRCRLDAAGTHRRRDESREGRGAGPPGERAGPDAGMPSDHPGEAGTTEIGLAREGASHAGR